MNGEKASLSISSMTPCPGHLHGRLQVNAIKPQSSSSLEAVCSNPLGIGEVPSGTFPRRHRARSFRSQAPRAIRHRPRVRARHQPDQQRPSHRQHFRRPISDQRPQFGIDHVIANRIIQTRTLISTGYEVRSTRFRRYRTFCEHEAQARFKPPDRSPEPPAAIRSLASIAVSARKFSPPYDLRVFPHAAHTASTRGQSPKMHRHQEADDAGEYAKASRTLICEKFSVSKRAPTSAEQAREHSIAITLGR